MIVYMFSELDLIKDEPLVHFLGFAHLVKTLGGTNEPDTGRQAPEMKMYFLMKMGIFQPAMLVYRSVFIEFQAELWSALKLTTFPRLLLIPHELACEKSCLLKPQRKERTDEHPLSNHQFSKFFLLLEMFLGMGVFSSKKRWMVRSFFHFFNYQCGRSNYKNSELSNKLAFGSPIMKIFNRATQ